MLPEILSVVEQDMKLGNDYANTKDMVRTLAIHR